MAEQTHRSGVSGQLVTPQAASHARERLLRGLTALAAAVARTANRRPVHGPDSRH